MDQEHTAPQATPALTDAEQVERWADDHFSQGEVAVVMRLYSEFGWRPAGAVAAALAPVERLLSLGAQAGTINGHGYIYHQHIADAVDAGRRAALAEGKGGEHAPDPGWNPTDATVACDWCGECAWCTREAPRG